jgi:protein phosphatase
LIDGQDGVITQITSDHSFVEALVTAGHITREEAETHPMKNVLYRALGQAEDLDVDVYYARVQHDDRLVLCSDGLTLHVKPDEIAEHALAEGDPEAASQRLIDLANERGGKDNVSVIVIKVVDPQFGSEFEEMQAAYGDEDYDDDDTLILANRDAVKLKLDEMQKTLDTDTTQTSIDSQGEGQDTLKPDQ